MTLPETVAVVCTDDLIRYRGENIFLLTRFVFGDESDI